MSPLPDLNEPLSDYEKALLEKLFADPSSLPSKFKTWVADYVSTNGTFNVSSLPTLKGEEWREIGATGQPAFGTNLHNYGGGFQTCAFYKDPLGIVRFKGLLQATGAVTAFTSVLFTLPGGYWPSLQHLGGALTNITGAYYPGRIDVKANGEVVSGYTLANGDWIALDLITFRAA